MQINLNIDIQPFDIPKTVNINSKHSLTQQAMSINDIPYDVLVSLCNDFKTRVLQSRENYRIKCILAEDDTY